MKGRFGTYTEDEELVIDYALTHRRVEPATDKCRAICEKLVREHMFRERSGPDPRFTVFEPHSWLVMMARDVARKNGLEEWQGALS